MSALFPLAFPIFFAGMWIGVAYAFSQLSGWSVLAGRYRAPAAPEGERLTWTSARLGGVNFKNALNMTLSPSGLYLVPTLPFRAFMPALLIPWTDVRFEGFTRMFFIEYASFRLGAGGPVLAVFRRTGLRFRPRLAGEAGAAFDSGKQFSESLFDPRMMRIAAIAAAVGLAAAVLASKVGR